MRRIDHYGMVNYDTTERVTDFRRALYRAISNGDIAKADEIMKIMYMVDIDRELIWEARR